jgi:hypothetical protein
VTRFLDVRLAPVGGNLATTVAVNQGSDISNYAGLTLEQLQADIKARHVLIATHGFNVNRAAGIASLSNWDGLLGLDAGSIFIGLLWPGDSTWAHGLDYPDEARVANDAAKIIAPFIDANFAGAASVSFASHSLGARVILETISLLKMPVRRAIIMAGAIDDNCLDTEFKAAAAKVGAISVLASKKDEVLAAAFPLGNLIAGIIAEGHPWWHGALGRGGPSNPMPANFAAPFEIPDSWNFGHGNYIGVEPLPAPPITRPANVPPGNPPTPDFPATNWHAAWTAAVAATRFK